MKTKIRLPKFAFIAACIISLCSIITSCKKTEAPLQQSNAFVVNDASQYSTDVIDKWITMQLRLMRNSTGIANVAFSRYYAYSGIAAFEAIAPGAEAEASQREKWNGLINLPQINASQKFYWPASVNTALAFMNRNMFINANPVDSAAIDSLERAINSSYLQTNNAWVVAASNAFGRAVASAVFNWSETDGYKHASDPYTPPVGPGLWIPTPPTFASASTPYWGNNRVIVKGDIDNTQSGPPIPYSENTNSAFYKMVKQLYDTSLNLTSDEMAQALFWRDIPGVSSPGHWLSILQQVLKQTNTHLDKAAFAYAVTGTCLNDACISCWQTKYHYNQLRPVSYIQNVMGITTWNSFIATPAHPEYSAAHAVLSAATAEAFTAIFGNIGSFTDHTYDYMGFAPRTYSSFNAIAKEVGHSRFYGGIHYMPSVDSGFIQGRKVTANILKELGIR